MNPSGSTVFTARGGAGTSAPPGGEDFFLPQMFGGYNNSLYICRRNVKELVMKVQTVKIGKEKLIPSGAPREGISVRRSGIAKVLWRKLNVDVPASKVIVGGVDLYKD